jgi:NAD+ diphosphatase
MRLDLIPVIGERQSAHLYLGRHAGTAVFAVAESESEDTYDSGRLTEPAGGWVHPFMTGERLIAPHRELMMVALALTNWHRTMPFSPRDGGATTPAQGGWARLDERGGEHFPRTDPAVIMLIEHDNKVLLGSNVLWESGRFSLLAGFVEAGESAEQAVVREVREEAGVEVGNVRYVASQPWPFPRSLMLGFRASLSPGADPADLIPDTSEISELRWFTRDELVRPVPGLLLPGKLSIARWLIDKWVDEGDSGR